jgi:hypothetical protein
MLRRRDAAFIVRAGVGDSELVIVCDGVVRGRCRLIGLERRRSC